MYLYLYFEARGLTVDWKYSGESPSNSSIQSSNFLSRW